MLQRIVDAAEKPQVLFLVGDGKPVLQQADARADQHALEFRHGAEELLVFFGRAEAHHFLDARAVVPAAIEEHDFARRRQVRYIALKIPLRPFAVVGRRQRHDSRHARIEPLRDALDHAALAGGVASLEQDQDLLSRSDHPVLQLHQFGLEPKQLTEVGLPVALFRGAFLAFRNPRKRMAVLNLHLQFFIVAIGDIEADAPNHLFMIKCR